MNDQTIPDVTDDDRRIAREWAGFINSNAVLANLEMRAAARVILNAVPAPPRPTLADMTDEERRECRRMQADVKGMKGRRVIAYPGDGGEMTQIMLPNGPAVDIDPENVTPRPDLPRWEYPGDQESEGAAPVKVGTVIESADDPRLAALPVGSVLRDRDGGAFNVTKNCDGKWDGPGYEPVPCSGSKFGPWTVRRIGWVADQ